MVYSCSEQKPFLTVFIPKGDYCCVQKNRRTRIRKFAALQNHRNAIRERANYEIAKSSTVLPKIGKQNNKLIQYIAHKKARKNNLKSSMHGYNT